SRARQRRTRGAARSRPSSHSYCPGAGRPPRTAATAAGTLRLGRARGAQAMRVISASAVEQTLDFPSLVERLLYAFRVGCTVPPRQHCAVPVPGGTQGTLLLMPAWVEGKFLGVKIVSVFPDNAARKMDSVLGSYILMSANTGLPLAAIDGRML